MSSTPRPIRRLIEYTARSGCSIRLLRAALPITGWFSSSSATTEGTRFKPSSPGITTGVSPCMKATREFVVPRSIPTMWSEAIYFSVPIISVSRVALPGAAARGASEPRTVVPP